jgi:NAD(P)-dependent dehydrogenase (short-subunit alcohol dehydrogenase family)
MHTRHTLTKTPILPAETVISHFDDREKYDGMSRYPDSKLLVNAFVRHLATVVSSDEIVANTLCPGMVQTRFDRTLPSPLRAVMFLVRKVMARTVDEGARTLIFASAVAGPETHGKFMQNNLVDK